MKSNWTLLLALALLIAAASSYILTNQYAGRLHKECLAMNERQTEAETRTSSASSERAEYDAIERLSAKIREKVRWGSDTTALMRSFADAASASGVRFVKCTMIPLDQMGEKIAAGKLMRTRFDILCQGSHKTLMGYVERIERSPNVVIVESLSLWASRENNGTGEARLVVSCLYPVPPEKSADNSAPGQSMLAYSAVPNPTSGSLKGSMNQ